MEAKGMKKAAIWVLIVSLLFTGMMIPDGVRAATTYMVFFDSDGGSDCGYLVGIPENTTISLPTPVKEGYTFGGWYRDSQYTEQFTNYTKVTSNLVLYAKWTEKWISEIKAEYTGEPVILNRRPNKKDFVVTVYYYDRTSKSVTDFVLEDDLINKIGDNRVKVTYVTNGNTYSRTVVVKGIEEPLYYVIFDSQGGTSVKPKDGIHANTYVELPAEPTKSGYIFDGWYTDSTYTTEFTDKTPITKSIILYAKWEPETPKQEKIVYELNESQINLNLNETEAVFVESLNPYLDVVYWSSDEKVAKVDEAGIVTGLKSGKATITAYVSDTSQSFQCEVRVGTRQYITKIKTNVSAKQIKKGKTYKIRTTITPSAVTQKMLSYSSSDKSIATVSSTGVVTAKKKGVCYITVKTKDGSDLQKRVKIRVI